MRPTDPQPKSAAQPNRSHLQALKLKRKRLWKAPAVGAFSLVSSDTLCSSGVCGGISLTAWPCRSDASRASSP